MAPQNQSLTLSLNLNCSRATKAWRDLQKMMVQGEQELADMRKKVNGTSYADLFPEVEKNAEERLKRVKGLMKRFQGDYADLNAELVHIQTQSTARLKTLIADTQARMDSLNFQKQRKEWMELAKVRGEFERELKERNAKQEALQSRAQERIMREIHMSEQEVETMKKLQLAYAESMDKEDKYKRSIDRINKAKVAATKYTTDLAKAQQDLANAQAALNANPGDATAKANYDSSKKYVDELLAHPKKMPTALTERNANARLAQATQDRTAAETAYKQFMNTTGAGPIQGSITKLRALYKELEFLRDDTTDTKKAKQISAELERVKKHIDAMQTAPLRNLKAVLNDISNAKSIKQLQQYKTELTSIMHNSTNIKEASRAKRELEGLEVKIKEYGKEYMKLRDIKKVVAQGDQADVAQQKLAIESLERLAYMRGTSAKKAAEYKSMIEQLKNTTISLSEAESIYNNRTHGTVGEINAAIAAFDKLASAKNTSAKKSAEYTAKSKELRAELTKIAYDGKFVGQTLKNIKGASITDLEKAIKMCDERMKNLDRTTKEYLYHRDNISKMNAELSRTKGQVDKTNASFKEQKDLIGSVTKNLMNMLGIFGGFYMVRQQFQKAFEANLKYDEAMANIRKTTQLTSDATYQLGENIKRIRTRTSLEDMNNLAYAAGRLGVKGADNIMGFVRAANQINVALGEQLKGKEAVEQLMKITNLMGINDKYGLEEALLKTGSAINQLTMESTASAQPIVDFMRRTAGISKQAGVSTSELVGLAAAINSLGQNVELSATSISKMFVSITSKSDKVIKALKMSAEEAERFKLDIGSGNMMDAFLTVLRKTNEAGGLSHLGTIVKDLGSDGQRVIQTISTLASNYSVVEKMVKSSTDAFEKGTSATNEYNIKNENTAALWMKLKNDFSKLFVGEEMTKFFHDILVNLQQLPYAFKNFTASFGWVIAGLEKMVKLFTEATWVFEGFANTLVVKAIANTITGWVFGIIKFVKGLEAAKEASDKLRLAQMKANVWVAAISIIVGALITWINHVDKAKEAMRTLHEDLQRAKDQYQSTAKAIKDFDDKQRELGENTVERSALLQEINNKYGDYIDGLIKEGEGYDVVSQKLQAVNEQLRMKALLTAKADSETRIRDSYTNQRGAAMGDLVNAIMQEMSNPDRETARNIAQSMVDNIDNILVSEKDASGNVVEYGQSVGSDMIREGGRNAIGSRNLYSAFGGAAVKSQLFNTENGVGFMEGGSVDDMVKALKAYGNANASMNKELRASEEMYQADIQRSARVANATYAPQAAQQFADVASMVKLTGKSDKTGSLELEAGVVRDDKGNIVGRTGLAEQRHTDEWTRMKQGMDKDTRNANIKELDEYIKVQRQNVLGLKNMGKDKEEEYNKESVYLSNAERLREILSLGKLETKEDKTNGGGKQSDEYNDIIAKIEAYYKIREAALTRDYNNGKMTKVQYQNAMSENSDKLSSALSGARGRILGDLSETDYKLVFAQMANDFIDGMGDIGGQALHKIQATGDVRTIGEHLEAKAKITDEDGEKSSALLSNISKERQKDEDDILDRARKTKDEIRKMWIEDNPFGGLVDKYQERFEQMGIMLANLHAEEGRSLEKMSSDVMKTYLTIGQNIGDYNMNTENGLEKFRNYLKTFPDLAENAKVATSEQLRAIYYQSYEFADEYETRIAKMLEKDSKNWDRLYKLSTVYKDGLDKQKSLEYRGEFLKSSETYGGSKRNTQKNAVDQKWNKLEQERGIWENRKVQAQEKLTAAEGMDANDPKRQEAIDAAKDELKEVEKIPDSVNEAIKGVIDEMTTLNEMTYEWVADMQDAFEQFMDGFVPFRSWYTDNGSFAENVFGTKEQRQEAFGQFMDDMKKTIRKSIVEYVRMKTQEQIIDRMANRKKLLEEAKQNLLRQGLKKEELTTERVTEEAKVLLKQQSEAQQTAAATTGSTDRKTKSADEATVGMWGNFGKAMTAAWADGGPFLGAVLSAVVGAALGAVMTMVFNMIGKNSGGGNKTSTSTKLVSGMLTYDRGNVQSFGVRTYDGGLMPVMGDNGKVYMAAPVGQLGTGMVMKPTLTSIGGAPALVGEEGPEMVIGRETTHALQMNRPDIMRIIMEYDKNRSHGRVKTYDSGNVSAASGADTIGMSGSEMAATMAALAQTLDNIQRNGIAAKINKYGRGGLVDEVASGIEQVNRVGAMGNVRRVFGK